MCLFRDLILLLAGSGVMNLLVGLIPVLLKLLLVYDLLATLIDYWSKKMERESVTSFIIGSARLEFFNNQTQNFVGINVSWSLI